MALVALFGTLWFRVPFVGNPLILLLGTCLFLLSTLGLGLLISTLAQDPAAGLRRELLRDQSDLHALGLRLSHRQHARAAAMADLRQSARYYLVVIRATFLKGVGFDALWPDLLGMAALGAVLLGISMLRFRKSLD